jgi:hypothetical protein
VAWARTDAVNMIRACIGDAHQDRQEHKVDVTPSPDGLHDRFFVGRTRVVDESFRVFVQGETIEDNWQLEPATGVLTFNTAPSGVVQTTYFWQWFYDTELLMYLDDAAQQIGYLSIDDTALPFALRSIVIDLALAHAFTRKASESAEHIEAAATDGYTLRDRSHPNWLALAEASLKRSQTKFDWYINSPLAAARPSMAVTTFRLPIFTPRR